MIAATIRTSPTENENLEVNFPKPLVKTGKKYCLYPSEKPGMNQARRLTNTTKNEIATNIFVPFFIDAPSTRRNIVYLV